MIASDAREASGRCVAIIRSISGGRFRSRDSLRRLYLLKPEVVAICCRALDHNLSVKVRGDGSFANDMREEPVLYSTFDRSGIRALTGLR